MNKFIKFPLFIMAVAIICTTIVVGVHNVTQPILDAKAKSAGESRSGYIAHLAMSD